MVLLLSLPFLLSQCATPSAPPRPTRQVERATSSPAGPITHYLLYVPPGDPPADGWPLILFLHGEGERGSELSLVKREGLPRLLESLERFPFLVVSPQVETKRWPVAALDKFLDEVLAAHPADPRRVSVTGLSSGAVGALELAILRPERIATVVSIAANRAPAGLCRLRGVPIWIFHGAHDGRVPVRRARRIARRVEACGGSVRLTIDPAGGHDVWTDTYNRSDLYAWMRERRAAGP